MRTNPDKLSPGALLTIQPTAGTSTIEVLYAIKWARDLVDEIDRKDVAEVLKAHAGPRARANFYARLRYVLMSLALAHAPDPSRRLTWRERFTGRLNP